MFEVIFKSENERDKPIQPTMPSIYKRAIQTRDLKSGSTPKYKAQDVAAKPPKPKKVGKLSNALQRRFRTFSQSVSIREKLRLGLDLG